MKLLIDKEDQKFLEIHSFNWDGRYFKAHEYIRKTWPKPKYKTIYLHRLIIQAPKGVEVDHINGKGNDNRKMNLRLVNRSQNQANRHKIINKHGYKGIYSRNDGRKKKWASEITVNYKKIHLGFFNDKIEAAKAYDEAAKKYYGEYAKTNF
ncbi:MAG: homing endonuclease [Podoviridae sp. ctg2L5]|nr:MAG: homing endonuclease [Podoviridae sp. ctg2L5]